MIENRETKPLPVKKSEWFVFAMHFQDLVLSIFDSRGSAVKQYSDIVDICSVKYEFSWFFTFFAASKLLNTKFINKRKSWVMV